MAAKLLALLFSGLFALGFGAAGLYGGLLPLLEIGANAWSSRDWQPVAGQVLEADIELAPRRYTTTHVRYRYEFDGASYESSRIGIGRSAGDSVGNWQRQWYSTLNSARLHMQPVTVWVDPQRPQRAVLDREIRWSMVVFHTPFALAFTAIAGGALYAFLYLLVTPLQVLQARKASRKGPADDGRMRGARLWLLAAFWCVLAWPMTALVWMEPQPWLPRIAVSLFAGVGAWVLWHAWNGGSLKTTTND